MKTIFKVEGMSCSHCENAVKNAVSGISGVNDVTVDLNTKIVTVIHDEGLSVDTIKSEIEEQGYEVANKVE